jgi:cyclin-dependent kinase 7
MPNSSMTSQVVTRWYRAPELLFGARLYTGAVDIWACGCILAELMLRTPYLPGDSDMGQLNTIFRALGTPTEEEWPGVSSLPDYVKFTQYPRTPFKQLFTAASNDALDLLAKMLAFDPAKRASARNV